MKKVTFATIAAACNTSVGTVSRAINGKTDINPDTRNEILRVAKELGYPRQSIRQSKHKIGVVFSKEDHQFYADVISGINDAIKIVEPQGIAVDLLQTEYLTVEEQLPLLDSISHNEYDALIINCAGPETQAYINTFMDNGVAVATFNTDVLNSRRLFFVGTDSFRAGQLGAELIAQLISGIGCIAVFGNFTGDASWMSRFNGFCSVIQRDYPGIEILPIFKHFDDEDTSRKELINLLNANSDINAIFPASLSCTKGTIRALSQLNRTDLKVVGYDVTHELRQGLDDGYCNALIYQYPNLQGFLSITLMTDYLKTGRLPTFNQTDIPSTIVFKSNIDSIISFGR